MDDKAYRISPAEIFCYGVAVMLAAAAQVALLFGVAL
jgi:hypothetical protein